MKPVHKQVTLMWQDTQIGDSLPLVPTIQGCRKGC